MIIFGAWILQCPLHTIALSLTNLEQPLAAIMGSLLSKDPSLALDPTALQVALRCEDRRMMPPIKTTDHTSNQKSSFDELWSLLLQTVRIMLVAAAALIAGVLSLFSKNDVEV